MSNLLNLSMQMLICLVIAALIGFIIGYLFGTIKKCEEHDDEITVKKNNTITVQPEIKTTPEPVSVALETKIEDNGKKPETLTWPLDGEPDDLKKIKGIGPKLEKLLNELGIFHFDQIASWTEDNAKWIDNYIAFKGRVEREGWITQAETLARGEDTEFSKKVEEKNIYSLKQ
ncbi:MAG: hypothetical protein GXO12_04675 [Epsilonproteobacteria bacterium]|nr:hypothetical protein [Campylobacterota bacterium]